MSEFSVTFVVGATSEAEALKTTVRTVMQSCAPQDVARVLIVRSENATAECVAASRELERAYPAKVFGMVQSRPHVGGAIRDGFDTAESSHILLLPGDLAISLAAVPVLIEKEKNAPQGIVKTSRWLNGGAFHGYPPVRKAVNACAQAFLRVLYRTGLTDLTNPVQIMPTALYKSIDWRELNFPFLAEMVLCPLRLGTPFSEIPADCYGRREGKSNNSFAQTAAYLRTALRIRFTKPQRLLKPNERTGVFAAEKKQR
jgi:hypothetical protein